MSLTVSLQTLIRERLTSDRDLAWLLSPDTPRHHVRTDGFPADRHIAKRIADDGALDLLPRITLGEGQVMPADWMSSWRDEAALTLHIWTAGPGSLTAQRIMGAITRLTRITVPVKADGYMIHRLVTAHSRIIRDPGGHIHGVQTLHAIAKEI